MGKKPRAAKKRRPIKGIERRLGDRIRALREELVISHAELSRRAEVSASHLTRIEAGRQVINVKTLEKIAKGLGVPISRLFEEEDDAPPPATQRLYKIVGQLRGRDEETLEAVEAIVSKALGLADRNS